jgi:beta-glucosidase
MVKRVAVIGPHADNKKIVGSWWCAYKPDETVTVLEGVKSLLPNAEILCEAGCTLDIEDKDYSQIDKAVALAKNADVVILCVGEDQADSGESNSKAKLTLPSVQKELIKRVSESNKNTALVLFTGRPLVLTDVEDKVGAILNMYFPGTEGGNAVARLLFGECSPSGKLTMSFPRNEGQCPIYYNHHRTANLRTDDNKRILYESGYIDSPNSPLYPFGYGLSYSNFEYSEFKLSSKVLTEDGSIVASVKVKNTGNLKAKEIVQLYIRDLVGSLVRPIKELKGFEKIELLPNEEKIVEFVINEDMLKFVRRD